MAFLIYLFSKFRKPNILHEECDNLSPNNITRTLHSIYEEEKLSSAKHVREKSVTDAPNVKCGKTVSCEYISAIIDWCDSLITSQGFFRGLRPRILFSAGCLSCSGFLCSCWTQLLSHFLNSAVLKHHNPFFDPCPFSQSLSSIVSQSQIPSEQISSVLQLLTTPCITVISRPRQSHRLHYKHHRHSFTNKLSNAFPLHGLRAQPQQTVGMVSLVIQYAMLHRFRTFKM